MLGRHFRTGMAGVLGHFGRQEHGTLTNYAFGLTALRDSPYPVTCSRTRAEHVRAAVRHDHACRSPEPRHHVPAARRQHPAGQGILPYFSCESARRCRSSTRPRRPRPGQSFRQDDRRDLLLVRFPERHRDVGSHASNTSSPIWTTSRTRPGSYQSHYVERRSTASTSDRRSTGDRTRASTSTSERTGRAESDIHDARGQRVSHHRSQRRLVEHLQLPVLASGQRRGQPPLTQTTACRC